MSDRGYRGPQSAAALVEARHLLDRSARALALSPFQRECARHALALTAWLLGDDERRELDAVCASDPSGLARSARALIQEAAEPGSAAPAAALLAAVEEYRAARARGLDANAALDRARARAEGDAVVTEVLAEDLSTWCDPPGR